MGRARLFSLPENQQKLCEEGCILYSVSSVRTEETEAEAGPLPLDLSQIQGKNSLESCRETGCKKEGLCNLLKANYKPGIFYVESGKKILYFKFIWT